MNAIKLLFIILLGLNTLSAQYVLDETGLMAGGGVSPAGAPIQTGAGGNLTFFWTHYNCGKSYGYHLTAGLRYLGYKVNTDTLPGTVPLQNTVVSIAFTGKFRLKNFHRKTEIAFLFGPGLSYYLPGGIPKDDGSPEITRTSLIPEAQLAVWWKKDLTKHQTLFISPGVHLPLSSVFAVDGASAFAPPYVYLNVGFSWWNNK